MPSNLYSYGPRIHHKENLLESVTTHLNVEKILTELQRNLVDHFQRTEPENCLTDSTDTHSQHCGVDSDHNGNKINKRFFYTCII